MIQKTYEIVACLSLAILICSWAPAAESVAQQGQAGQPTVGYAVRHDVSERLEVMADRLLSPVQQSPREIPLGIPKDLPARPDIAGVPDPLRQTESRPFPEAALTPQPELNFEGLSNDDNAAVIGGRIVPPDTEGDVGLDYYVQWINLVFAVYDKSTGLIVPGGGPFPGNSLWNGFGGFCELNNDGDPIVLYDHLNDRWFLSQFSVDEGVQCIAISQAGDPRGPYDRWEFVVSPGEANDYPKFGLMPDAYYLSLRDFPSNDGTFASAVAFDRQAMLAGAANPTFVKFSLPCLINNCPDAIQPPHLEGPVPAAGTPGVFSRIWDDDFEGPLTGSDGYRLWEFVADFATPANSTFTELSFVAGANFDSTMCGFFQRNCIPQPPPGEGLDPVDELQMYRAQFRSFVSHDSLVVSTTADSTGSNVAGVRWAELRDSGGGWTLYQEGTFAPADGLHRWMSSIAMDGAGNIALGYSVSNTSTFPSVRYTSREAGDPLDTMPGGEVELVAGSDVQTSSFNRWGDYSTMSVDPANDCTFWYTQEYQENDDGQTSFDFKTRIGSFTVPSCGGPACLVDADCDDGLFCNGAEVCSAGICQAGTPVNCDDAVSCTADSCNEATDSCDNIPNNALCANNFFCDGVEICDPVLGCQPGADPCPGQSCNERKDTCSGGGGCVVNADCDDGLFCNGAETCNGGVCQPGTNPCPGQTCDEGSDTCSSADCVVNADCSDGKFCNGAEICDAGTCQPGADPCPGQSCNERTDTCSGGGGCVVDADCNDGKFCNGVETCSGGICQPGTNPCPGQTCNERQDTCTG